MARMWGIRHMRWFYHAWRLEKWVRECARAGLGLGYANQNDVDTLNAIWRGEL
jgi:hypothetical protein